MPLELAVLVGLQASGKSTFYRSHLATTHALVSKDLLHNNRRPARRQLVLVREALAAGRTVAVDNTNPSREERAELIALALAHGADAVCYYFDGALDGCLERNRLREGRARVPGVALFDVRKRLVPPSAREGFVRMFLVRLVPGAGFIVLPWEGMKDEG
jgi:predicted kinase